MLSAMLLFGVRTFLCACGAAIRRPTVSYKIKKPTFAKQKWENCYEKEYYYKSNIILEL